MQAAPSDQMPMTCGSCGTVRACAKFCESCSMAVCNICMTEGEEHCLYCQHFASEQLIQKATMCNVQQNCGNCGTSCSSAEFCYGCASPVCNTCMVAEEACCLHCLETYPVYSSTRARPVWSFDQLAMPPGCAMSGQPTVLLPEQPFTQGVQTPRTDSDQLADRPACNAAILSLDRFVTPVLEAPNWDSTKYTTMSPTMSNASNATTMSPTKLGSGYTTEVESGNASVAESTCCDEESDDDSLSKEATTMMICNIPCRLSQEAVVAAIHSVGFAGTYDFVYLPDRKRGAHGARASGNIGYAFVNFKGPHHAENFVASFDNFQFPGTHSAKRCTLKYAHCQGFDANNGPQAPRRSKGLALDDAPKPHRRW